MKLESKYDIGQLVWFYDVGRKSPVPAQIRYITVYCNIKNNPFYSYGVDHLDSKRKTEVAEEALYARRPTE